MRLRATLADIAKYFRAPEWFFSVLPLVLAAPLYCLLAGRVSCPAGRFPPLFLAFFVFCAVFLSFGYLINDFSDREEDFLAGKQKVIYRVPAGVSVAVMVLQVVLGFVVLGAACAWRPAVLATVAVTYFLGAAYSIPGLRLKQRGVWGLVCSSFAQRGMLVVLAGVVFGMGLLATLDWALLSFLNGLRYILVHQMLDYRNDQATHTRTFAQEHGLGTVRALVWVVLVVEVALLVPSVLVPLARVNGTLLVAGLVVYLLAAGLLNAIFVVVFGKRDLLYTYDLVPLESFLNAFVPAAAALALAFAPAVVGAMGASAIADTSAIAGGGWFILVAVLFLLAGAPLLADKCKNFRYARQVFSRRG